MYTGIGFQTNLTVKHTVCFVYVAAKSNKTKIWQKNESGKTTMDLPENPSTDELASIFAVLYKTRPSA